MKRIVLMHKMKSTVATSAVKEKTRTRKSTLEEHTIPKTIMRYAYDDEAVEDQEETGWKYIHGDVFRYRKNKSLFAACLGSGTQLFSLTIFIFLLALVGEFYPYNRGPLFTALVVIYALTSGIDGYTATSFYCQLEGTNWAMNLILTGCMFCGPLFVTFCFLNTVAIMYNATAALSFGTIVVIVLIWTLVMSPLLVLGSIDGKNSKTEFQAPCRIAKFPREIPPLPWYRGTIAQMAMASSSPSGALVFLYYFGCIFVCCFSRDNIETQVSSVVDHVSSGTTVLQKAKWLQKNSRKWMCIW